MAANKQGSAFTYEHGESLTDQISGFMGVVTGRADYITGCRQYLLQPKGESSNKKADAEWFDEGRLTHEPDKPKEVKPSETGGPQVNAAPVK